MDDRLIARWRMHSLHLAGRSFDSPAAVISGLLGVQAENHAQAGWAVAARTKTLTEEEFGKAFDNGQLLRTHVLRPTWHFVLPDDIRWLLDLTGPRIKRTMKSFARQLGLDDHDLGRSADLLAEALSDGDHLTRSDLRESLERGEVTTDGPRLSLLLMNAELSSVMCSGRMQGKRHTYARLEDRAPDARRLDREEALAELVFRYVRGHGPASERDITYWATLTLTDVRAGLAAVAHRLDRFEHDGREFWFVPPRPPGDDVVPRAHLLQVLDEYHHGYQDSRYVLDMDELGPRGRPATMGMALVDGQLVADMKRAIDSGGVSFLLTPLRKLGDDEIEALEAAAGRYGAYLGLEATLELTSVTP